VFGIIEEKLDTGQDVMISGFGRRSVRDQRPRVGRNPQTGEEIVLDARRVITLKYSRALKEGVNRS